MDTDRRRVLNLAALVESLRAQGGQEVLTNPDLPPCPLCGALAFQGYGFRSPSEIEHDCNCQFQQPQDYLQGIHRAWRGYNAPKLLLADLENYPHYQEYLGRSLIVHQGNLAAISAGKKYRQGLLYLWGPPGVGKTHLALRLAAELVRKGRFVRFRSELDLLAEEREAATSEETVLPSYERLVLDDWGKSRLTPFTTERLYALIEGASAGRFDLIITSNYTPEASTTRLGEVGEAVVSRIRGGLVVQIEGPDRRST
jgi:DNA replication protein DnaC